MKNNVNKRLYSVLYRGAERGVGASLSDEEIAKWEREHLELLNRIAPDEFEVLHYAALAVLRNRRRLRLSVSMCALQLRPTRTYTTSCARYMQEAMPRRKWAIKRGDFSYNTGKLRCPTCDGTGTISLDVQFLPDVDIPCPDCKGSRYSKQAYNVKRIKKDGSDYSLPEIMELSVDEALDVCDDLKLVHSRLQTLHDMGLGYLTLGEETPGLSGGEAQRLKLASEMGKGQSDSVFVFDEPTIGLHPLDVRTLLTLSGPLVREPNLPQRWQNGDNAPSKCISCNMCYRTPAHECIFKARFKGNENYNASDISEGAPN